MRLSFVVRAWSVGGGGGDWVVSCGKVNEAGCCNSLYQGCMGWHKVMFMKLTLRRGNAQAGVLRGCAQTKRWATCHPAACRRCASQACAGKSKTGGWIPAFFHCTKPRLGEPLPAYVSEKSTACGMRILHKYRAGLCVSTSICLCILGAGGDGNAIYRTRSASLYRGTAA